jgi:toxin ParE1/3/4
MTKPWHFHPEAHEELVAAAEHYELQKPGLGDAFLRAFDAALLGLEGAPAAAAPVAFVSGDLGARRWFVRRFPYAIVFVELEDEFRIVAVSHLRRRPDYWGLRLERLERFPVSLSRALAVSVGVARGNLLGRDDLLDGLR